MKFPKRIKKVSKIRFSFERFTLHKIIKNLDNVKIGARKRTALVLSIGDEDPQLDLRIWHAHGINLSILISILQFGGELRA